MRLCLFGLALMGAVVLAGCDGSSTSEGRGGERRAEYRAACGADIQTHCPTAQTREERRACVNANKDKFSAGCKTYMAEHPWRGRNRDGGEGSDGQAPANP